MMLDSFIQNAHDIVVEGKYGTTFILPNLKENVAFDIFVNGEYEAKTVSFLKKTIPKNGVLMDLGANIGSILIPILKQRSDINAIAVEAAPWIYEYLQKNLSLNCESSRVHSLNYALFDFDDLQMNFYSPLDKFGKGSLSAVFTQEAVKVNTKKVDTILKNLKLNKVDTIKIDVEGFEYFVFKGAEELLESPAPPSIIFEFVDWAEAKAFGIEPGSAQSYLMQKGYNLYVMEGEKLVPLSSPVLKGAFNLFASK